MKIFFCFQEKFEAELKKQQNLVQELISRIFPNIKIPPQKSHLQWLQEFERIVQKEKDVVNVNVNVKPKSEPKREVSNNKNK